MTAVDERLRRLEQQGPPEFGVFDGRTLPAAAPLPDPMTPAGQAAEREQRRLIANRERLAAEEAHRAAEAAAELERQHEAWRKNTRRREDALRELPKVEAQLAELEHRRDELEQRRGDLLATVRIGVAP